MKGHDRPLIVTPSTTVVSLASESGNCARTFINAVGRVRPGLVHHEGACERLPLPRGGRLRIAQRALHHRVEIRTRLARLELHGPGAAWIDDQRLRLRPVTGVQPEDEDGGFHPVPDTHAQPRSRLDPDQRRGDHGRASGLGHGPDTQPRAVGGLDPPVGPHDLQRDLPHAVPVRPGGSPVVVGLHHGKAALDADRNQEIARRDAGTGVGRRRGRRCLSAEGGSRENQGGEGQRAPHAEVGQGWLLGRGVGREAGRPRTTCGIGRLPARRESATVP